MACGFLGEALVELLRQRSGIVLTSVAVLERRATGEADRHPACGRVRRDEDVAIERSDLGDARAIGLQVRSVIAKAVVVTADRREAVRIDDLPADSAVATAPMPGDRARRVTRREDGDQDRVTDPHHLAI